MTTFTEETGSVSLFDYSFSYYMMKRLWNTLEGEEWRPNDQYLWEAVVDPLEGEYIQKWALGTGSSKQECLNSLLTCLSNIILNQKT